MQAVEVTAHDPNGSLRAPASVDGSCPSGTLPAPSSSTTCRWDVSTPRAHARNVVVTIYGAGPRRAPVVVMTPRSSWWQSTSERGGGLVCWPRTHASQWLASWFREPAGSWPRL